MLIYIEFKCNSHRLYVTYTQQTIGGVDIPLTSLLNCRIIFTANLPDLDHDPLFTRGFREILRSGGVESVRLPPRSPNLNAYAERFVLSIKSECLNRIIPLGERHLRMAIDEYVEHYHVERTHQGLDNQLIDGVPEKRDGPVECRVRLSGLLSSYYRKAA